MIFINPDCSQNKMQTANPDEYYSTSSMCLGNKEKASCFLYLLQFENTTLICETKIEYV